jgi:rhodanese-related sulfurtransferase
MEQISAADVRRIDGALVLDVREYGANGVAPFERVLRMPMSEVGDRVPELPRCSLYVLCEDGLKSRRVAAYLWGLGFDAVVVSGGLVDGAVTRPEEGSERRTAAR